MLDIPEVKIGAIQTDTIAERATVLAKGPLCLDSGLHQFQVGQVIYFKAWAVDVVSHEGKKHYFISEDSDAICAYE